MSGTYILHCYNCNKNSVLVNCIQPYQCPKCGIVLCEHAWREAK